MQSLADVEGVWTAIQGLPSWQGALLVVTVSVATAVALRVGGDRVIRRVTERIPGDVDAIVFGGVHTGLYLTVAIGGLAAAVRLFDLGAPTVENAEATTLSVLTLLWMVLLVRIGRRVSNEITDDRYVDRQVVPIFQNVWTAVVVGGGLLLLLVYWNVNVTPFLASAGIAGIVVGLAAKDTIANLFGSIALYLDGTYRVGDYVVLESGERGRVEDISVRSTVIRTRDDVLVTVPNATLNNAAIVNESTPKRKRRIRVPVSVAYGSDLDEVEALLETAATDHETVLDRPEPRVRLREFGGSGLNYELLCWVPNPAFRARVTHDLNRAVYDAFQGAGVEIPYPKRDVQVTTVGPGDGVADPRSEADPARAPDAERTPERVEGFDREADVGGPNRQD